MLPFTKLNLIHEFTFSLTFSLLLSIQKLLNSMLTVLIQDIFNQDQCLLWLRLGTHLFVKVLRPGDSEVTFWSSSHAATCYYQSNHSKVEAIQLSALPKDTTSNPTWTRPVVRNRRGGSGSSLYGYSRLLQFWGFRWK